MSNKREASPEPRPPTNPKFHLVKNAFEIFDNRVAVISADTGYAKNPNRLKYFLKMVKIRRRVENLLKSYPKWQPEPAPHDPKEATIPPHLERTLQRLAMPSRKYVMATFVKINEMINELKNDHYFYKNPSKTRRIKELCIYRKQICCLYSNYSPEPDPTYSCYRFRPCSTKFIPIYGIARSNKNKKRIVKINSRVLFFDFDNETIELALPSYQRIKNTFDFYKNMASQLKTQICEHSDSLNKKRILGELLCATSKRRDFLDSLKAEIECRKKIEVKPEEKNEKFAVEGTFDKKFTSFTPYTHFLELPSKKKLKDTLEVQKLLLEKTNKEVEHAKVAKTYSANTKKYSSKIESNVKFIENILESYPVEEKPPHCEKPEEVVEAEKKIVSVKTVTENGKTSKQYTFDEKTNELAFPKLGVIMKAKEVQDELLRQFEKDSKKAANLKKPDPPAPKEEPEQAGEDTEQAEEDTEQAEEDTEQAQGPKKLPSEGQKNQMKAAKEAEIIKRDHAGLKDRTERLAELLKAQTDRIERMQTSKVDGAPSYMYHHMVCCAEQEVDKYDEYKMQSEHKPVTNSVATRCRIQASLEVYQNFLNSRERDIVFQKQFELVKKALEETEQNAAGDDTNETEAVEENPVEKNPEEVEPVNEAAEETTDDNACQPPEPEEKIEKADKHLLQLYKNMKLLEKMLEENPEVVSCVHTMSHKKFEPEAFVPVDSRAIDKGRLVELAKPTEKRLRNTLEGFGRLMTLEKQERIELLLTKKVDSAEKLEEAAESLKEVLSQRVAPPNELEKAAKLLKLIEEKVKADMFDKMAYKLKKKLPKLIRKYKEPVMVTSYWINLRDIGLNLILSSHGPPTSQKELKVIYNFAGVIADFIIKLQLRALRSKCPSNFSCSKPLHCVRNNEYLINLSSKLMRKLKESSNSVE